MQRIDICRASVDSNLVTFEIVSAGVEDILYGSAVLLFGWCADTRSERVSHCHKIMTLRNKAIEMMNGTVDIDLYRGT